MSLNFDYKNVATLPNGDDPKHAPLDPSKWHPVGDALVWASISVGLGEISDKTIDKWEQRIAILQAMDGPYLQWDTPTGDRVKGYITRADLEAFKGLRVNVAAETDAQFLRKLLRSAPATVPMKGERVEPAYAKASMVARAWRAKSNADIRQQVENATRQAEFFGADFEVLLHRPADEEVQHAV